MTEELQRKFVKPASISESLKCIVCSEVFVSPIRLYCSHTFCKICIDGIMKANGSCPMCRTKIDKKNWGPDRIAQNIINDLQVFCPVEDCPWKGLNSQLQTHYNDECEMKNRVINSGKSHKKTKNFNFEMIKDEEVEEKINANLKKGSLGARIEMAWRKNQSRQNNEALLNHEQEKKEKKEEEKLEKKDVSGIADFLEELFE